MPVNPRTLLGWGLLVVLLASIAWATLSTSLPPADFTFPVLDYDHSQGQSITGGYVYRGCALPAIAGTYFYADYTSNFIRSFSIDSTDLASPSITDKRDRTAELDPPGSDSIRKISTFGRDARGEIYIADLFSGKIFKIVAGN